MPWVPKGCSAVARHARCALASFVPRLHPTEWTDDLRSAGAQSDRREGHDTYNARSHTTPASPGAHGPLAAVGAVPFRTPVGHGARRLQSLRCRMGLFSA